MNHGGNVWRGGAPSDWLDYSANIRPDRAPDWVYAAMMAGLENARYYPDPHARAARTALARSLGLDEGQVLPTAGGISAIDMATHLDARAMYAFAPCFSEYARQAANRGLKLEEIPLLRASHEMIDPLEALGDRDIRGCALWLCNPLNPVGTAFSGATVTALLARVEDAQGWLIVDEAFIQYCPQYSSCGLLADHPRLLIAGSMTKALGIPGIRLGYLCAHPDCLDALMRYQLTWELNCVAEAVLRALPEHMAELQEDARRNARRREELRAALSRMGAYVYPSQANFLLTDFGRDVEEIEEYLRARRILVRSCMNFSGIDDGRHLRLAVKDEASNERLIREIEGAIKCAESH